MYPLPFFVASGPADLKRSGPSQGHQDRYDIYSEPVHPTPRTSPRARGYWTSAIYGLTVATAVFAAGCHGGANLLNHPGGPHAAGYYQPRLWHFQPTSWQPLSPELVGRTYGEMVAEEVMMIPPQPGTGVEQSVPGSEELQSGQLRGPIPDGSPQADPLMPLQPPVPQPPVPQPPVPQPLGDQLPATADPPIPPAGLLPSPQAPPTVKME